MEFGAFQTFIENITSFFNMTYIMSIEEKNKNTCYYQITIWHIEDDHLSLKVLARQCPPDHIYYSSMVDFQVKTKRCNPQATLR